MSDTTRLRLPLLASAQAQKHVTHNEALGRLDALVHLTFQSRTQTTPPDSPVEGDCYLVPEEAEGDWSAAVGEIAHYLDGAWAFYVPVAGMLAWVIDESALLVCGGESWGAAASGFSPAVISTLSVSAHGAASCLATLEEDLMDLSGAYVETSALIPNRAVVFGVSTRTLTDISGASSYDCGVSGNTSQFGGSLGIAVGATNAGVIGPSGFYADTPVRLTANGGDFAGGSVRLAVHCFLPVIPGAD